jgi:hypothetical protein
VIAPSELIESGQVSVCVLAGHAIPGDSLSQLGLRWLAGESGGCESDTPQGNARSQRAREIAKSLAKHSE